MATGQNWAHGIPWRKLSRTERVQRLNQLIDQYTIKEASGCWVWTGKRNSGGYGLLPHGNPFDEIASRASLMLKYGDWPFPHNLLACHTCDNPPCVNPEHLFWGSYRENALDRFRKGRYRVKKGVI